jgi:hypothetical protein
MGDVKTSSDCSASHELSDRREQIDRQRKPEKNIKLNLTGQHEMTRQRGPLCICQRLIEPTAEDIGSWLWGPNLSFTPHKKDGRLKRFSGRAA